MYLHKEYKSFCELNARKLPVFTSQILDILAAFHIHLSIVNFKISHFTFKTDPPFFKLEQVLNLGRTKAAAFWNWQRPVQLYSLESAELNDSDILIEYKHLMENAYGFNLRISKIYLCLNLGLFQSIIALVQVLHKRSNAMSSPKPQREKKISSVLKRTVTTTWSFRVCQH